MPGRRGSGRLFAVTRTRTQPAIDPPAASWWRRPDASLRRVPVVDAVLAGVLAVLTFVAHDVGYLLALR